MDTIFRIISKYDIGRDGKLRFSILLTHIFAPLGFEAGGQVFVLRQQPGSGPPDMQVVPVGHCYGLLLIQNMEIMDV